MRFKTHGLAALLVPALLLFTTCSDKSSDPDGGGGNPNASSIDEYFAGLPDYTAPSMVPSSENDGPPVYIIVEEGPVGDVWELDYKCGVTESKAVLETEEIFSPDMNFGALWPGNLVQGNSIVDGTLKPIPLDRGSITMTISVDVPQTSVEVDNPNSITAQQAVSDLKLSVDPDLDGENAPSNPGTVTFKVEESSSFSQAMLSMGITGAYSQPMSVTIAGSANVSVQRSYTSQTIVARMVQKLFTIRVADDLPELRQPSGWFASHVTAGDMEEAEVAGTMGPDNLPMYIESVTYGRILVFTLTSATTTSADSLAAAMNASYSKYQGGGDLSVEHEEILASRTVEVYQAGGDPSSAQAAVQSLDFSQFFVEMEATSAVPISFKAKPLKTGAQGDYITMVDSSTYSVRNDCERPAGYEVTVRLDRVVHEEQFCASCPWTSKAMASKQGLQTDFFLGTGAFVGAPPETDNVDNEHVFTYWEPDRAAIVKAKYVFEGVFNGFAGYSPEYTYPFNAINRGSSWTGNFAVTGLGARARFYFQAVKTPVYAK